jgi:hypothetical protein
MATLPKPVYMFNAIPIKIPMTLFTEIEKWIQKFIGKHKRPQKAKAILNKMSNVGGITMPDFKVHYRTIAIKMCPSTSRHKNRPTEQSRKYRHKSMQLQPTDFWQRSPKYIVGKRQPLLQMLLGALDALR